MNNKSKTYHIITFGCAMNYSDSDRIETILQDCGLTMAKSGMESDLVIINSCSVRKMAEDRTYGQIAKFAKSKKKPKVIATGCLVSDKTWKMLLGKGKFDLYLPIDQMIELPKYLKEWKLSKSQISPFRAQANLKSQNNELPPRSARASLSAPPKLGGELNKYKHYLDIIPKGKQKFSAYIPIMTGCDNFCSYCAVPYTRGREVSRPMEDIIEEAKRLADNGCVELTLLGQNVNSYAAKSYNHNLKIDIVSSMSSRTESPQGTSRSGISSVAKIVNIENEIPVQAGDDKTNQFVELLKKISDIKELKRIFFLSSHPKDMSDDLIRLVGERENLCNYIHLPVQSGDNDILKKMNRKYTREDYLKLVEKIRKWIPNVALTTDLIVGFPGESDEQFEQSVKLFEECDFDMAFISEYSPRPKTVASKMEDSVSDKEKGRRKKFLNDEVLAVSALQNNEKLVGKTLSVLVSKSKKDKLIGYTEGMKQVFFEGNDDLIGKIVDVKITKAMKWVLEGELQT